MIFLLNVVSDLVGSEGIAGSNQPQEANDLSTFFVLFGCCILILFLWFIFLISTNKKK